MPNVVCAIDKTSQLNLIVSDTLELHWTESKTHMVSSKERQIHLGNRTTGLVNFRAVLTSVIHIQKVEIP
jgi:hypothetical protein